MNEEKYHFYEYPGIHRSLVFAFRGAMFYYNEKRQPELSLKVESGYRCYSQMKAKDRFTCNHLGKALDLHVYEKAGVDWARNAEKRAAYSDDLREHFRQKCAAHTNWTKRNAFSLEPRNIAPTWVHLDVREFSMQYLKESFFAKNNDVLNGSPMQTLL